MLDAVFDPQIEFVILQTSAQIGKTTIVENIIGYYVDQDPSPTLCIQPTLEMAETFSEDRLAPMIRDTDCLRKKIADPKSRDSGNKKLHKKFLGGHITIGGANSPAFLASRPIRILLAEEVDRWPSSAGSEGDPLSLAINRTKNFWNRKIIIDSTPTIKDASKIEYWYNLSDKRVYEVPCPDCNKFQELKFDNLKWDKDESGKHLPETAYYICNGCGVIINHNQKSDLLKNGRWRKTATSKNIAGFKINELYSPWSSWAGMAQDFLNKKDDPEKLKVFINTSLAETFELRGDAPEWMRLYGRRENYKRNTIPAGGLLMTAGIDVQGDRVEYEITAWGRGKESWSIDYRILPGNPEGPEVWNILNNIFEEVFHHEIGGEMKIKLAAIDSGYATTQVYGWGRQHGENRVMVIKGRDSQSAILSHPKNIDIRKDGRRISAGVKLWNIGVNIIKSEIYSYLRLEPIDEENYPAGYCHFPEYDEEYFKQLTAEQIVKEKSKSGFYRYMFVKSRPRNEALDCRVYSRAAAEMAGISRYTDKHWDFLEKSIKDGKRQTTTNNPKKRPGQLSGGIKL